MFDELDSSLALSLLNIAGSAVVFYVGIVTLVRVLGKRTTSQMNNFDWIITITVGSLVASGILLDNVTIVEASVAILVLAAMQFITTWLVIRSELVRDLVKARPTLLLNKGEFLKKAMRRTRISEAEIWSALRSHGMYNAADANWVILETNGEMTVIPAKKDDVINISNVGSMQGVNLPSNLRD